MKPNEQHVAARRRQRNLLAGLGILALVLLSVASFKSYSDLRLGRGRAAELEQEIAAGDRRIEALEDRVRRLEEDPAMLEQLAREEMMMARPGEVVIVLPASPAGDEASTAAPAAGRETTEGDDG